MIHTVKGFSVVNKANVFLDLSCFFNDPADIGNLISGSSAFSKTSLNIREFMVHVLLKPGLENFEHYDGYKWRYNGLAPFPKLEAALKGHSSFRAPRGTSRDLCCSSTSPSVHFCSPVLITGALATHPPAGESESPPGKPT